MGFLSAIKAQKAYRLQQKGQTQEAIRMYEEAFGEGVNDARYNLAYALLIIREGQYQKAKDFLVAHQKTPGMSPEQRTTLLVDYAACCFRLGDLDKGIQKLEEQFRKTETGLLFQTLGYLYVEKYDQANRPDFDELRRSAAALQAEEQSEESVIPDQPAQNPEEEIAAGSGEAAEVETDPEKAWEEGVEKAEAFLKKAVDYDEQDAICLDNMGQFVYRVKGDRKAARIWFERALKEKENQIDTLFFLSRYDEEEGNRTAALEKLKTAAAGRFSPLNYCTRELVNAEIARLKGEIGS